jgi:hypothetical protein
MYSFVPTRPSARRSWRAYVSEPPDSPGESVRRERPTRTLSAYSPYQLINMCPG